MGEPKTKSSSVPGLIFWLTAVGVCTLIAAAVVPNFIKARTCSCANACVNNLRQIDAAKNEWALEHSATNGTYVSKADIKPYIKLNATGNIPSCPAGGKYILGKIGENPICSLGTTATPGHVLP
jgi:hypothetical protein